MHLTYDHRSITAFVKQTVRTRGRGPRPQIRPAPDSSLREGPGKGRSRLKKARIRRPGTIIHNNSICKFRNYFPGFLPRQSANFQQNIHCTCFQEAKKRDREKKLRKNLVRSRGGYLYTRKTPPQEPRASIYISIENFLKFTVLCLA